ncbi:putative glycolipid-binding domain-containing protein [Pseudorhodoferax sp. Leaf267]|uniref:putative glycolipid-binding domain-containing protein n=1 Tax=Pseudorhodoferax sp. Leaf267 TaxID=1736316 RepID=UPI0006F27FB8|nr:putative glycolipid-binding domain-containing protein [Pseudorhodoferax sp. Leaf267]KQP12739.1 hypothetical protein ASF43_21200 [Pseudorhodoferax sp. Leaf267]
MDRTLCWAPLWNPAQLGIGLEHLLLTASSADSIVLAIDEERGPFRLAYRLHWTDTWQLRSATFDLTLGHTTRSRQLRTDGLGHWHDAQGDALPDLDGCLDIDIWPTPFTNSFPIRRAPLAVGERSEFRMAWVFGPDLTVKAQAQAYTRLAERLYRFETLDGSGFQADLPVDADGIVLDYPGLFQRVHAGH